MTTYPTLSHSKRPPCYCHDCLRALAQADQRRADIEHIRRTLDALGLPIRLASEMDAEANRD